MTEYTPDGAADALGRFEAALPGVIRASLLRELGSLKDAAEVAARRTKIGEALFGRAKFRAYFALGAPREEGGGTIEATLFASGMAAMIEEGGKTKAHPEAPKNAKVLRFV